MNVNIKLIAVALISFFLGWLVATGSGPSTNNKANTSFGNGSFGITNEYTNQKFSDVCAELGMSGCPCQGYVYTSSSCAVQLDEVLLQKRIERMKEERSSDNIMSSSSRLE